MKPDYLRPDLIGVWFIAIGLAVALYTRRIRWTLLIILGWLLTLAPAFLTGCASAPPPVVVQQAPAPVATPIPIPPDPYANLPTDVVQAIKHNETPTLHHGITTIYAYSPDIQYSLNCEADKVTVIRLRDDEWTNKENVKIGDKDRWGTIIGDHEVMVFPQGTIVPITVPGAQITIPADPHMVTNLAIHTTLGNDYVFNPVKEVRSDKAFDEKVAFYYPDLVRQQDAYRKQLMQQEGKQ